MFKTLKSKTSISKGLFGKCYKGECFVYIDGTLLNERFEVLGENLSLTKAAKLITNYENINGRSWFKKITIDELTSEAVAKLKEKGFLQE